MRMEIVNEKTIVQAWLSISADAEAIELTKEEGAELKPEMESVLKLGNLNFKS